MSYFGVSLRNGVGLGLGTVPSLTNTPLSYRLAPSLDLSFAGSDALSPAITFSRTTNATVTGSNGLIQNAPMNLLPFSEQFDNAYWAKIEATVSANQIAAPDGTFTADKILTTAVNSAHVVYKQAIVSTGTVTLSVYAKAGEYSWLFMSDTNSTSNGANFNLATGVLGTVGSNATATITPTGNGWYRCTVTLATSPSPGMGLYVQNANNVISFVGNATSGIYIWGAQLELGSTATTYNPTTVKNLLGFTENFDNAAWTKSNASISATKVDDIYGQPFAQKLVENTAASVAHRVGVSLTVGTNPFTTSVYFKAAERSWAYFRMDDAASTKYAYFDLDTGSVGTVTSGITASIVAVGSGWYRCAATFPSPSAGAGSVNFGVTTANGVFSYTGDGTSGIYIFGAQLSDSASVDPYVYQPVAAPTSTAYYGPRFDYDPVTLAPKGLLIEEQRTNLVTYSESFDNAAWTKSATTVTSNSVVSPDGTVDADILTSDGTATQHSVSASPTLAVTTAYAFSVYAKAGTTNFLQITTNLVAGSINHYANFNLQTGVVSAVGSSATATIQAVGNGWYRCTAVMTSVLTSSSATFILIPIDSGTAARNPSFSAVTSVYIWGAQLEAGAFATSYIPTVASQVTRAADSASMIGNNFARWYNVTQGTLYSEFSGQTGWAVQLGEGSNFANRIALGAIPTNFAVTDGAGVNQALLLSYTGTATTFVKIAGAYRANDFAASFSGFAPGEDTSGTVPNPSSMTIGFRNVSSPNAFLNSTIKRIAYFPRRLANAEIQSITA